MDRGPGYVQAEKLLLLTLPSGHEGWLSVTVFAPNRGVWFPLMPVARLPVPSSLQSPGVCRVPFPSHPFITWVSRPLIFP